MKNALTIDVEDWYQTLDFHFPRETWDGYEDRIEDSLKRLTDVLEQNDVKATFFVLSSLARKHRGLIRNLAENGHEIASHGSFHQLVYEQSPDEFREDVRSSRKALEDITGRKIEMFRASSWSISLPTLWALDILEEEGFVCDSSVQPFHTFLSGMKNAPVSPYHPVLNGRRLRLLEFPPTVFSVGKIVIPFAGGFYLRAFPQPVIERLLKRVNRKRSGLLYIHPWEVDAGQPRLKVPPLVRLSHYYHLKRNLDKFDRLVRAFAPVPLGTLVREGNYPSIAL